MAAIHKSTLLGSAACVAAVLLLLTFCPGESNAAVSSLLTGFDIGKLTSKIAITGTVFNPRNYEKRFETLSSLLSFFDLQERINNRLHVALLNSTSENEIPEEEYLALNIMTIVVEKVIQDSCNYINWTLSDFYVDFPFGCGGFSLSRQSFNCSRDAAEKLQLKLQFWRLNRDLYNNLRDNRCYSNGGCSLMSRTEWVKGLKLNTSDPVESDVNRYLNCII